MGSFKIKAVMVDCGNCGGQALSDEFKLDTLKGVMICPHCEKEKIKEDIEKNNVEKKPAGWDDIDDYLEKSYKSKTEKKEVSLDKPFLNLTCDKCEYKFRYNAIKQWPNVCPSCSKKIQM